MIIQGPTKSKGLLPSTYLSGRRANLATDKQQAHTGKAHMLEN